MSRPTLNFGVCLHAGPSRVPPRALRAYPSSIASTSRRAFASAISRRQAAYGFPPSCPRSLGYCRLNSTSAPLTPRKPHECTGRLTEEERRAHERLSPILTALPGPVDWAVAYGSGVRHQANADPSGKPPMTDFLLSTPSLAEFHTANLRQNPSHYPLTARLLGGERVAWLTDSWGAGVWYVTMVQIKGLEVKYGVISTERLKRDLQDWETLYVAGRLHKPVLPLLTPSSLLQPLQSNLRSALILSLLLLPPTFPETALWTQIAGISYAGDPRMSVPGAEHPDKIANIVKGKGALEGMRALYGGFLGELGVEWDKAEKETEKQVGEWEWRGSGERTMRRPESPEHLVSLITSLPVGLRERVKEQLTTSPAASSASPSMTAAANLDQAAWLAILNRQDPSSPAPGNEWRTVLLQEVAKIIRRPATTQSLKGLFTAGFRKSFVYALAKFNKWLGARRKEKKK